MLWELAEEIETPALVVDYDTLRNNVESMAVQLRHKGVTLRPHTKTHKCPVIARLQLQNGAKGITVATIGEAEVFADAGFDDVFIAYPIYAAGRKAERLRALAERTTLSVGVDSMDAAEPLAKAFGSAELSVLVEIDSGLHRSGVAPEIAPEIGLGCLRLGMTVKGVFTHGGHGYVPTRAQVAHAARQEAEMLSAAAAFLSREGVRVETVSAGSTPTAIGSAMGAVNEERPGTYVFNDRQQVEVGSATRGDVAVAVAATVVSTAVPGHAVLDAGSKTLSSDRPDWLPGHGIVPELDDALVVRLSECHGIVDLGGRPPPAVGTVVRVVPNHVCTTVNMFDVLEVVSRGKLVDRWDVSARGHLS